MKTKNLMIGVLTVAVVVLSYLLYRSTTERESSHESAQLNQKELNKSSENDTTKDFYNCDGKDTLISTDGSVTSWSKVKPFIDSFDPNEEVKAFHIGINNMHDLMGKIDAYNSSASTGNKIVGLRFYRTKTTRTYVTSGNNQRTVNNELDLIVLPTLAEKNLHEANPPLNGSVNVPIYWHFRPCPRLCKKKKPTT